MHESTHRQRQRQTPVQTTRTVALWWCLLSFSCCNAFSIIMTPRRSAINNALSTLPALRLSSSSSSNEGGSEDAKEPKIKGDKLREATGIRPSLHPTTINAIADALKCRATKSKQKELPLRLIDDVKPLDIALSAGRIASTAIGKRQEASKQDGMVLTPEEEQVIAGRVVGVIMRLDELETTLAEKVSKVDWIAKFNEYATFGVLKKEIQAIKDGKGSGDVSNDDVDMKIRDDPLFCMNRAECLLGLFIQTVEIPQMEKIKQTVIDDSKIDFLDEDRVDVLLKK